MRTICFTLILLTVVFIQPGFSEEKVDDSSTVKSFCNISDNEIAAANRLIDFIKNSPTSFHVVQNATEILKKNGFSELLFDSNWELEKGGKYFVTQNGSSFIAFIVGTGDIKHKGFKIVGVHADSPDIRIKPNPEMVTEHYLKFNIEVYGGPILNTWFDRPLSIAGRVALKSESIMKPELKLLNMDKPIAIIPNLAIHLNPDINKGLEIKKQKMLLPVFCTVEDKFKKENFINKLIADELKIPADKILDYDLSFYDCQRGTVIGINNDFIFSGRLDDLEAVFAGLEAIKAASPTLATNILACFDNEEVGSRTKQGADSPLLTEVMERITLALGAKRADYLMSIANSFMLSSDAAHAIHPNYADKNDPTNKPVINGGPVVKVSLSQKYTSDGNSMAIFKEIAEKAKISYQVYACHSDIKGGSTIGPITSTHLPIKSADVGVPMLGMHSIKETCGVRDHAYMIKLFNEFYKID